MNYKSSKVCLKLYCIREREKERGKKKYLLQNLGSLDLKEIKKSALSSLACVRCIHRDVFPI